MKPAWWQLYGLAALLVALIGVIEADIPAGALRSILEGAVVVLVFGFMLDLARHR